MGVRIYPNTKDSNILEKLAGVSQGTMERLNQTRKAQEQFIADLRAKGDDGFGYGGKFYDEIHNDPDMGALDSFLTFGWGKLTNSSWEALKANPSLWEGDDCSGESKNDAFCAMLLQAQDFSEPFTALLNGVNIHDLQGLHWG
jgi:hypothetical protein